MVVYIGFIRIVIYPGISLPLRFLVFVSMRESFSHSPLSAARFASLPAACHRSITTVQRSRTCWSITLCISRNRLYVPSVSTSRKPCLAVRLHRSASVVSTTYRCRPFGVPSAEAVAPRGSDRPSFRFRSSPHCTHRSRSLHACVTRVAATRHSSRGGTFVRTINLE